MARSVQTCLSLHSQSFGVTNIEMWLVGSGCLIHTGGIFLQGLLLSASTGISIPWSSVEDQVWFVGAFLFLHNFL